MNPFLRLGQALPRTAAGGVLAAMLVLGTIDVAAAADPVASISASTTIGNAPLSVMFKGHSSQDPDGRISEFRWNFGNGTGSGPVAKATYTEPGTYLVTLTVTDNSGASDTSDPMTITVLGSSSSPSNSPPVISGSPSTSVTSGTTYTFRPAASDADGDPLTFSIQNKPAWASFSTSTGTVGGTPTAADVGSYSNIVIAVSDGQQSASLSAFSISVVDVGGGSVTLNWTPPTENTDGSTITNLAGYRIGYGTSVNNLSKTISLMNPGLTSAVIESLTAGTWYFAVRAVNSAGVESDYSQVASKTLK